MSDNASNNPMAAARKRVVEWTGDECDANLANEIVLAFLRAVPVEKLQLALVGHHWSQEEPLAEGIGSELSKAALEYLIRLAEAGSA